MAPNNALADHSAKKKITNTNSSDTESISSESTTTTNAPSTDQGLGTRLHQPPLGTTAKPGSNEPEVCLMMGERQVMDLAVGTAIF